MALTVNSSDEEEEGIASHFILNSPSSTLKPTNKNVQKKQKKSSSSSNSKKESIFLFLVGVFVLNAINGQKIVKSVNSQFDDLQEYMMPTVVSEQNSNWQLSDKKNESTAIIITSSWIPSHPSTYMMETVINSTAERLRGLSSTAPIFITIDHFRFTDFSNLPPVLEQRIKDVEQYSINLMNLYLMDPRIHVIPATQHLHIGGSVIKALNLIEHHYPTVRYVYSLQHDFFFFKDMDHLGMENAMDDHPKINYIRFPKKSPHTFRRWCGEEEPIYYNRTVHTITPDMSTNATARQLVLWPTADYSDNNHLVRLPWYKKTIASLVKLNRTPENPLQSRANVGCGQFAGPHPIYGLYLYHDMAIVHLNGRRTHSTP